MSETRIYSEGETTARLAAELPKWRLENGWIRRKFKTHSWKGTLMAVNAIGHLAEAAWHHPDLAVSYAFVEVKLTTHDAKGITDKDFELGKKIEDVVAIINGIAGQTNLLALNATIEAARAGDAGKGFAVVASEVKALAGQTGKATEQIGAQIQAIQSATKEAVEAIKAIGGTINEINDISTSIAAAMEEQGATTGEMTRNTQQAAQGTLEVSSTIGGVSQGANATGEAATQVLSAAAELGRKAETLRAEVGGFLTKIRAA